MQYATIRYCCLPDVPVPPSSVAMQWLLPYSAGRVTMQSIKYEWAQGLLMATWVMTHGPHVYCSWRHGSWRMGLMFTVPGDMGHDAWVSCLLFLATWVMTHGPHVYCSWRHGSWRLGLMFTVPGDKGQGAWASCLLFLTTFAMTHGPHIYWWNKLETWAVITPQFGWPTSVQIKNYCCSFPSILLVSP